MSTKRETGKENTSMYTMKFLSAIKKNEIMTFSGKWVDLDLTWALRSVAIAQFH